MERSLQWRRRYRFLPQNDLRRFEDVVFVHGKRSAYTGGVHLVFRLSAVSEAERTEGLDAVAAALVSHVEAQWVREKLTRPYTPIRLYCFFFCFFYLSAAIQRPTVPPTSDGE